MKIRLATAEDAQELIALAQFSIRTLCANDYTKHQLGVWTTRLNRPKRFTTAIEEQYFIVAEENDTLLGFASLLHGSYLDFIYVSPTHTRRGIAGKLYQNILSKAVEIGATKITSDVSKTARPFFEKQGFKVVARQENEIENEVLVNYKMELML